MIRGLYTSASGMVAQLRAQDVSANNLANVNTPGFKKDIPTFAAFPELFLYRLNVVLPVRWGQALPRLPSAPWGRGFPGRVVTG